MQNPDLLIHEQSSPVNLSAKDIARFWAKVNKDGPTMPHMETPCWVWTANKHEDGYGRMNVGGKVLTAHRIAWTLQFGDIPSRLCVMHRCDNPACCRVDHLMLGTHKENMRDMENKGRQARGDKNGSRLHPESRPRGEASRRAKLTAAQVAEIRSAYAAGGIHQRRLAAQFEVGETLISNIINRKIWKHI
jgi:hypothetical protein